MSWPDRRWPLWLLLPVLGVGVFAGVLMTWHHETQAYAPAERGQLIGCAASESVDCDLVNTSEWSEIAGVPLAALAVAGYLATVLLALGGLRGRRDAVTLIVLAGGASTLLSGWLLYVSIGQLGFLCSWCLRMYAVNGSILALGLLAGRPGWPRRRTVTGAGGVLFVLLAVTIAAQRLYRQALMGAGPGLAGSAASQSSDDGVQLVARSFPTRTEDGNQRSLRIEGGDAWKGNPEASVVVVEFADFQCGYCKRAGAELQRLVASYGDRVLFVFKHFPMDPGCNPGVKNRRHPNACGAAAAAECAKEQGRFWPFHDLAFKNQHQLGPENLRAYGSQSGLDLEQYQACLGGPRALGRVRADGEQGSSLDVRGTPRIFIAGKVYRGGTSAEAIAVAIEEALGTGSAAAAHRAKALRIDSRVELIPSDIPPMQRVSFGSLAFSIDTFEASLVGGKAFSGKHLVPATRMSWYAARDACATAGKRLCTEQEWVTACQGALAVDDNRNRQFADDMIEGTAYPYGDHHDRGRCWDGNLEPSFRPVYTGQMPGCAGQAGIYDLTGNVEEWVGQNPEQAALLGGAWDTKDDHARCYRRNDTYGAGFANQRTGFRCCSAAD